MALGHKVLAFCGRAQDDVCLMDGVYILHTNEDPIRWQRVGGEGGGGWGGGAEEGVRASWPSPRGAHGFGYIDGKIVVFGGYGPPAQAGQLGGAAGVGEQPLDDLFFLHLKGNGCDDDERGVAGAMDENMAAAIG